MRSLAALVFATLLCGCATQATRGSVGEVTGITLWVTSWGRTLEKWSIHADGTATLELRPREMSLLEPLTPQSFAVTPEDFVRVRAALAGAERYAGSSLPCSSSDVVTDAPSGRVIWTRADGRDIQTDWYAGCLGRDARRDAFFDRIEAADGIVREIAAASG